MAFTTRQAASEQKSAQEAAAKPSAQLFSDQRASTSVQLKQQQLMQAAQVPAQLAAEEEEPLQGKFVAQRVEEEEPLQGKFATAQLAGMEEEPLQGKFATAQLAGMEEEEPIQGKFEPLQRAAEEEKSLQMKTFANQQFPSGIVQRKTEINYGGLQDFTFDWGADSETGKVATSMHAELDPKYPKIGTDTSGSDAFGALFTELQKRTPTSWVRGHLLNHDLGGVAHYNNLFPITTAANGEHYHEVEKHVKHWLANKCEVTYDVDAKKAGGDDSVDGVFICEAEVKKDPLGSGLAGQKIQKAILSHGLAKATTDRVTRKKGTKQVEKHSGVQHGKLNTVLRDDNGRIKKDGRWNHKTGTSKINNQEEKNNFYIDPIDLTDWDSGYVGDDIEAGEYDSQFDQDAFDEWLSG